MSHQEIIDVVFNKKSNDKDLYIALFIIRIHIEYCIKNKINLYDDTLLQKVLLFR